MPAPDSGRSGLWPELAGPAVLTAWFLGTGIAGVSASYRPVDLLWLGLCYALLSVALHQGALMLKGLGGRPGAWIGSFLLSLTVVLQLREQTLVPDSIALAVAVAALAAPVVFAVFVWAPAPASWRRRALAVSVAIVAPLVAVAAGSRASETFRWHLLRHNTLLGTPTYYLFEPPVEEIQARLFGLHRLVPPPGTQEVEPPAIAPAGPRPNLVFVLLDTLRADALAGWGGDPGLMPNLNRRLEGAVRFTDVWANASWTRPSMASLFTGLLPEEHGALGVDDALAEDFSTLAERMAGLGYRTVAFTTNLAATGRGAGFAQGFDTFVELEGSPYARAERVDRAVSAWLAREEVEPPVFLYLHFLDPHEPYLAGEGPARRTAGEYRRALDDELRYLDGHLERILDRVEAALPGPEILLVASDHGEELFEHELFGHGQNLYQEVIHVPVAVRGPGIGPGAVAAPLELRDFHDLVLALGRDDAVDPAAWARENARDRRYSSLYYSTTGRLLLRPYLRRVATRAMQEGNEKLVWSAYGDTRELYDLATDPEETRNLVAERPHRADELSRSLDDSVRFWVEPTPIEASDKEREQLKALGYVD